MSKQFNLGFLAGAAWAAGIVGDAAERAVNRPPSPDYERDGPRVRESAAEVLGVASELILANAEAALGDCDSLPPNNETIIRAPAPTRDAASFRTALTKGYTGNACPDCGNLTMVRNGTCLKCETCGGTTKEARGFCFEALVSTERARP